MRGTYLVELRGERPLDEEDVCEEQHHRDAPDDGDRCLEEPVGPLVVVARDPRVEDRDDEQRREDRLRDDRIDRHLRPRIHRAEL